MVYYLLGCGWSSDGGKVDGVIMARLPEFTSNLLLRGGGLLRSGVATERYFREEFVSTLIRDRGEV